MVRIGLFIVLLTSLIPSHGYAQSKAELNESISDFILSNSLGSKPAENCLRDVNLFLDTISYDEAIKWTKIKDLDEQYVFTMSYLSLDSSEKVIGNVSFLCVWENLEVKNIFLIEEYRSSLSNLIGFMKNSRTTDLNIHLNFLESFISDWENLGFEDNDLYLQDLSLDDSHQIKYSISIKSSEDYDLLQPISDLKSRKLLLNPNYLLYFFSDSFETTKDYEFCKQRVTSKVRREVVYMPNKGIIISNKIIEEFETSKIDRW